MAGRGSRFAEIGYTVPKPLIDVRGRPMYSWAMDSLPLHAASRVVFICLREHLTDLSLEQDIKTRYASLNPVIIPLDKVTEGQACTVLEAREFINNDEPLIIYNADTYCVSSSDNAYTNLSEDVDGVISVFRAEGDKWSFARMDETGRVVETAEKRRISEWATTGLYYFARGKDFVSHAEKMIDANERVNNEFYVAPVYNRMITDGANIRCDIASEVWVLGTPEDLEHFLKSETQL